MKSMTITERVKTVLAPKSIEIKARLFVTREDGITIYDSVQDKTTTSVAALVSGVWQASEALMSLVTGENQAMEFRLGFDTSSQGIYLFPFGLDGKRYFLGAIYSDCLNPGLLKRQVGIIKEEMEITLQKTMTPKTAVSSKRQGYLFQDITDLEMDRLFALGGI